MHSTGELAHDHGGSDFIWKREHVERSHLWKARHEWYYAGLALQPGKKVTGTLIETLCLYFHCLMVQQDIHKFKLVRYCRYIKRE